MPIDLHFVLPLELLPSMWKPCLDVTLSFPQMAREEAQLAAHEEEERARAAEARAAGMEGPQIEPEDFLHAWLWPEPPGAVQVDEVSSTEEVRTACPSRVNLAWSNVMSMLWSNLFPCDTKDNFLFGASPVTVVGTFFDSEYITKLLCHILTISAVHFQPEKLETAGPEIQPVVQGDDEQLELADIVSINSPVKELPQVSEGSHPGANDWPRASSFGLVSSHDILTMIQHPFLLPSYILSILYPSSLQMKVVGQSRPIQQTSEILHLRFAFVIET